MQSSTPEDDGDAPRTRIETNGVFASQVKRRKSFTQSIRARLSRQSSSGDSQRSSSSSTTTSEPPVPSIPRSYSAHSSTTTTTTTTGTCTLPTLDPKPTITRADLEAAFSTIVPPRFPDALPYTACYCEENIYLLLQQLSISLVSVNKSAINIAKQQRSKSTSKSLFVPLWDLHCIFISNETKTVLLYQQNASKLPNVGWPVIWDYHVVAAATCHLVPLSEVSLDSQGHVGVPNCFESEKMDWGKTWIYDFDSRLSSSLSSEREQQKIMVSMVDYHRGTFRPPITIRPPIDGKEQEEEEAAAAAAAAAGTIPNHFRPKFRVIPANEYLRWFASDRSHMLREDGWSSPRPSWEVIVGEKAKQMGIGNNLMQSYVDMSTLDERYGKVWSGEKWLALKNVPIAKEGALGTTIGEGRSNGSNKREEENCIVVESVKSEVDAEVDVQTQSVPLPINLPTRPEQVSQQAADGIKGGRIASPLFPAYLHASQSSRSQITPIPPPTL
ncbi:uncharacterized protein UTRI_02765 [Ustilago trichophora]|uniref:Protein N-terminal glutamine amidohydrolase n=1 Tax=Ustilago trichophora TaxID=86804 RepID=A0A5C3ENS8_9BASI|nr:uncharacterized protein UTRI_02765 [Ustilago trichophora]